MSSPLKTPSVTIQIKERFNPRLIPALYNNFRNVIEALLELIDNAVDDRIESEMLTVDITHRRGVLSIRNVGGRGMGLGELEEFLDWGGSTKRGKLGRYGQGGKAAMGYLSRSWEIWCKRNGDREAFRIVENDWHDRRAGLKTYTPERLESDDVRGCVSLRMWNLDRKLNLHQLACKLGDLYKPLVATRQVVFQVNGREIAPRSIPIAARSVTPIFIPVMPAFGCPLCASPGLAIRTRCCPRCGVAFVVSGWAGRLEPGAGMRGGLRCFSLGRMISSQEYFGHPEALERHSMSLLYGEVLFDFVPMILNKTDYQREGVAWTAVHDAIHLQIAPLVKSILAQEAEEGIPAAEADQAEQASRLIQRALRMISNRTPTTFAWKDGLPIPKSWPRAKGRTPGAGEGETSAPGPEGRKNAVRSGAQLQIELKRLDPTLRAALVDRDGLRALVINRDFPAYRLSGGSLAYLLETACLELVKRDASGEEGGPEMIDRAMRLLGESSEIALNGRRPSRRIDKIQLPSSAGPSQQEPTPGVAS